MKENPHPMPRTHDLQPDRVIQTIAASGHRQVMLQFPEGLKHHALQIAQTIEQRTGARVAISGDPCYGACDLPKASTLEGFDLLVHFGHSAMPDVAAQYPIETLYIEARADLDIRPAVALAAPRLEGPVGLVTTVQHIHKLDDAKAGLEEHGIESLVGKGDGRIAYPGQVLGCNFSAARSVADRAASFLYIGSGNFHPIGVALATGKPMVVADPYTTEIRTLDEVRDRLLRKRHAAIALAQDAQNFGILLSSKPGQRRQARARRLREMLEGHGRQGRMVEQDLLDPMTLSAFGFDCLVSVACPRIAIDDAGRYGVPLLTPPELEVALDERAWEGYVFDEITG